MTIIAFDGEEMVGDRAAWSGSMSYPVCKVYRLDKHILTFVKGPVLVGFSGTGWFCFKVLDWMRGGPHPGACPDDDKGRSCAMVVDRASRIWRLSAASLHPERVLAKRHALGATIGFAVAMGAMECGASARRAVRLCAKYTDVAGHGIDVVRLK